MPDEPLEPTDPELPAPPPELRERVLACCRREMAARLARDRQRQTGWSWSLAAAVVSLLLLNGVEERRSAAHIAALMASPDRMAPAPPAAPAAVGSLRARTTLLAALLRDPNAL